MSAKVYVYPKMTARWMCEDCGQVGNEYAVDLHGESVARGGAAVHDAHCPAAEGAEKCES